MTIQEFEKIFNLYYNSLFRYCLKFVRNSVHAEEIVQEQYIALWENRYKLPSIDNIESYLKISIRNRSINYLQSKFQKINYTEVKENHLQPNIENPLNMLEAKELQDAINKALDSLPDRCYTVYSLKRFESYTNKEIGEKLNISEKTVENYTTIAFGIIRDHVRKYFGK